jgi:aryl-alcohol dehydrogenase-like predicted oxidoreductase
MQYKRLGNTGLKVSQLALGCMTFGVPERGTHPWTLNEGDSRPIIRRAVELGINFFDTANMYSDGTSEEIVGRALKEFTRREDTVIATKVYYPMGKGPNRGGLSRKAIMTEVDASLRRLGTDYIDLYQIHRWDYDTPIEETLEAMHAWQFAKALYLADRHGWTRFSTMQNHLNLLYREEEREMLPLCTAEGVGVIPWSPLARGRLTRDWDEASKRSDTDDYMRKLYAATEEADRRVAEAVKAVAEARGIPRAQVAMAWVAQKAGVTAPIVGASKLSHLEDAVAALEVHLTAGEIARLEAPYVPHAVVGFV